MEQVNETKKARQRLSSGVVISIAAIIVSVCALFISIFEVRIMREQQHAMAWPYIEWLPGYAEERLTLTVENKGIGPAVIKKIKMEVEG
ncbi:MAG: hypothetical protein KDC44_09145, partial [Phaeodactylibacter sp.]|nr:hypothetical protein [Phaeodactylibacter sp.]